MSLNSTPRMHSYLRVNGCVHHARRYIYIYFSEIKVKPYPVRRKMLIGAVSSEKSRRADAKRRECDVCKNRNNFVPRQITSTNSYPRCKAKRKVDNMFLEELPEPNSIGQNAKILSTSGDICYSCAQEEQRQSATMALGHGQRTLTSRHHLRH